ncbi:hypothetical protein ACIS_00719 [Anaplasma centrale str. Israel]|uniref:Uncharacterized protein n=1 Tax=Anaplasma centrale (strain Israel) TaxID=574556 RepID=D1AUQ3_ANACI|nr:hypothetical protein [Anaplasma centrale]ACZ49281.1 hypothetical protein ACIS_00719 [Anaplasma centrale str. Israel]
MSLSVKKTGQRLVCVPRSALSLRSVQRVVLTRESCPRLSAAEKITGPDIESSEVEYQECEGRVEPGLPIAGTHPHMSHKEKVVVGCMVCLGVVLGSLLMHGAVTSIQEGSTLFFIMNIGGFIVIIAIAALIWNSIILVQMRRAPTQGYQSSTLHLEADFEADSSTRPSTNIGSTNPRNAAEAESASPSVTYPSLGL